MDISVLIFCFVCLGGPLAWLLWTSARHPHLIKIAWRNIWRRKATAVFIISGVMIGTALLSSALAVGDTLDNTVYKTVLDELGELDEVIATQAASDQVNFFSVESVRSVFFPEAMSDFLAQKQDDTIEAYLPAVVAYMAGEKIGSDGDALTSEPWITVLGTRIQDFRDFSKKPDLVDFTIDQCVISDKLAQAMDLDIGSQLKLHLWGIDKTFEVRQIIADRDFPSIHFENYSVLLNLTSVYNYLQAFKVSLAFVTVESMEALTSSPWVPKDIQTLRTLLDNLPPDPINLIMVSNIGDRHAGVYASEQAEQLLTRYIEDYRDSYPEYGQVDFLIRTAKADGQRAADRLGMTFSSLFLILSGFSLLAGMILIVNIFTLLAQERKKEIGMLRAVGTQRQQIAFLFLLEGIFYSLIASVLGALLGAAFTLGMVAVGQDIVIGTNFLPAALELDFHLTFEHFCLAVSLGVALTCLTVLLTSLHISRQNIIASFKDHLDTVSKRPARSSRIAAAGLLLIGLTLIPGGWLWQPARTVLWLWGTCSCLLAISLLWQQKKPRSNLIYFGILLGMLYAAWIGLQPGPADGLQYPRLLSVGLIVLAGAVTLTVRYQNLPIKLLTLIASLFTKSRAVAKLAFAYPARARWRTGLTLFVYAIVFLSVTLIAVVRDIQQQTYLSAQDRSLQGYDLQLKFKIGNPFFNLEKILADSQEIDSSLLSRIDTEPVIPISLRTAGSSKYISSTSITPLDQDNIASFALLPLIADSNAEQTNEDLWRSVLADPGAIILGQMQNQYLAESGLDLGQQILICSSTSEENCSVRTIKAFYDGSESFASLDGIQADLDIVFNKMRSSYLIDVAADRDIAQARQALQKVLSIHGAQVVDLHEQVRDQLSAQNTFYGVLQIYLIIGLVIGVCGLAVIMIRLVHERRHHIGLMRAIGFQKNQIAWGHVLESGMIAFLGLAIGLLVGLFVSYLVFDQQLMNTLGSGSKFVIPLEELALFFAIGIVLSLLASLYPACLAGNVQPARSLREAD